MERKVGVVSAHGFGDCLFNLPLIAALSRARGCKVGVAVEPHCADAFWNHPAVAEIVEISSMYQGEEKLAAAGYPERLQITQNIKFFEFRQHDGNHSLIDTARQTGLELGLRFDHRPQIKLTYRELSTPLPNGKIIAVESVYKSGQSWATKEAFKKIVHRHRGDTILWLSNEGAPPGTHAMLDRSRRELIGCLPRCDRFYSVGSGFFCASLVEGLAPRETVCLWIDDFYKYETPIADQGWNPAIRWVHNMAELEAAL